MPALLMSRVQAYSTLLFTAVVFQPVKGTCLLHLGRQEWTPSLWLDLLTPQGTRMLMQSPFSSESHPRGTGPNPTTIFSFQPDYMCIFLTAWLYRCPSASFQLVFSEDSSTCRCIFDVFGAGAVER